MGEHHPGRLGATVVSVVGFAISLVFNGLSVIGVRKSMLCFPLVFFFSLTYGGC